MQFANNKSRTSCPICTKCKRACTSARTTSHTHHTFNYIKLFALCTFYIFRIDNQSFKQCIYICILSALASAHTLFSIAAIYFHIFCLHISSFVHRPKRYTASGERFFKQSKWTF